MELKSLIHKELSEGLDEEELAASIGVSREVIKRILLGGIPKDVKTWKKFAAYFHMELDALQFGKTKLTASHSELLSPNPVTETVHYRKIPLLSWDKVGRATQRSGDPIEELEQTMIETDVAGARVFALRVKDNAMEPLFHKGEIVFVNPDLPPAQNHYVVVVTRGKDGEDARLRQLKKLENQLWLRALNPKYPDCPLTTRQRIVGRVVRLRMNL